jgi:hypothetical protein
MTRAGTEPQRERTPPTRGGNVALPALIGLAGVLIGALTTESVGVTSGGVISGWFMCSSLFAFYCIRARCQILHEGPSALAGGKELGRQRLRHSGFRGSAAVALPATPSRR